MDMYVKAVKFVQAAVCVWVHVCMCVCVNLADNTEKFNVSKGLM